MDRIDLTAKILATARKQSTASIMFHQNVAEALGLNITDHKCLSHIYENGSMTAGQIAENTGLTTGAITGLIDRLEKANLVERRPDKADRRKVLVHPLTNPDFKKVIEKQFSSLSASSKLLCEKFSETELQTILRFMSNSLDMLQTETEKLKTLNNQQKKANE